MWLLIGAVLAYLLAGFIVVSILRERHGEAPEGIRRQVELATLFMWPMVVFADILIYDPEIKR